MNEQIFEVIGNDGLVRRGILSLPRRASGLTVLLLPAGLKYHVGPHRLNVRLARWLADNGHLVLRFDPLGIGESDGHLDTATTNELWYRICLGYFVADTLLACKLLRERFKVSRLILIGLCGGGITAQLAAAEAPHLIQGIISIGIAVTLPNIGGSVTISSNVARQHMHSYIDKLSSKEAWARIIRGETDFRNMLKIVKTALVSKVSRSASSVNNDALPNENPLFIESFRQLQYHDIKHLLVFGKSDNRWLEFNTGILKRYLYQPVGLNYEVCVIPDANHELQFEPWKQKAMEEIEHWLAKYFPFSLSEIDI